VIISIIIDAEIAAGLSIAILLLAICLFEAAFEEEEYSTNTTFRGTK